MELTWVEWTVIPFFNTVSFLSVVNPITFVCAAVNLSELTISIDLIFFPITYSWFNQLV
jgi:hypothetical protein